MRVSFSPEPPEVADAAEVPEGVVAPRPALHSDTAVTFKPRLPSILGTPHYQRRATITR